MKITPLKVLRIDADKTLRLSVAFSVYRIVPVWGSKVSVGVGKRETLSDLIIQYVEEYSMHRNVVGVRRSSAPSPQRLTARHFPSLVPSTGTKRSAQRRCFVCQHSTKKPQKRSESRYMCKECDKGGNQKFECPGDVLKVELQEFSNKRQRLKSGRCYICPRAKDKKTTKWCNKCGKNVCTEHCSPTRFEISQELTAVIEISRSVYRHIANVPTKGKYAAKNHRCDFCNKCFYSNADLVRHVRVHTVLVLWSDGNSFHHEQDTAPTITDMSRVKKNKFRCETCPKTFRCNTDIIRHIRSHTGEKPFVCHVCSRGFTRKDSMRYHLMQRHGIH
ncbi:zinc finger protein [Trichonephila clavipes]|nr:zinc finger protein [Trichonephila clavipes]